MVNQINISKQQNDKPMCIASAKSLHANLLNIVYHKICANAAVIFHCIPKYVQVYGSISKDIIIKCSQNTFCLINNRKKLK